MLCDTTGGVSKRYYYQVLLACDASLALCGQISSAAPQAFYKCLLAGISVAPGQSAKHYQEVLKCPTPEYLSLPAPAEPIPLVAEEDDDDGILVPGLGGGSSAGIGINETLALAEADEQMQAQKHFLPLAVAKAATSVPKAVPKPAPVTGGAASSSHMTAPALFAPAAD
eukprot:396143-Karenia_brevis.AAC.1